MRLRPPAGDGHTARAPGPRRHLAPNSGAPRATGHPLQESDERLPVDPDQLFSGLDGRAINVARRRWILEVFSVLEQHGWRWIQLTLSGEPQYTLILRLTPGEGAVHALSLLSSWLVNPSGTRRILSVG